MENSGTIVVRCVLQEQFTLPVSPYHQAFFSVSETLWDIDIHVRGMSFAFLRSCSSLFLNKCVCGGDSINSKI